MKVEFTNGSVDGKSWVDAFSKETCDLIVEYLKKQPFPRWFHREKINSIPTTPGDIKSDYYFMGHMQLAAGDADYFVSISPTIEGQPPAEIGFNMYKPGNYMPEHIDRAMYRYTMVIQLCDMGDGIEIEGVFYEDVPGRAVVFEANSLPHAVPPTKHPRYVMICLYK